MNAIERLLADHVELRRTMDRLADIADQDIQERENLFKKFHELFKAHDKAEDEIVYPAAKEYEPLKKLVLKSYQAHHVVQVGIMELKLLPYNTESWAPKFLVVKDSITMHMDEEEQKLFPKLTQLIDQQKLETLGRDIEALRTKKTA